MSPPAKKYLIVLTGPTAVGKTNALLQLNGSGQTITISADSRQVYREMNIGTAKPSVEEIQKARIQLIDHVSITEEYNAGIYEREAMALIGEHFKSHDWCFLSGGTGLYIRAVTKGLDDFPRIDPQIRKTLEDIYEEKGLSPLAEELKLKDIEYYRIIDPKNPRRVIRALSVIRQSGRKFSDFISSKGKSRPFEVVNCVLELPREELYDRINKRVLKMMDQGLLEEVKSLYPYRELRALQTVGYQELFDFLDSKTSLEEAVEEIQKNTRRYAKRQGTWFRKYNPGPHFHPEDIEGIKRYIQNIIHL